ncbi:hydroxyacylglutathione hydrolase [Neptunomonas marina]|uniref:Hydroxyacylglutathione hydrolase n=1 Tax=Neptunomonas marina TaxID=1815562 RepID=A0A437QCG8_9GAMM|nr:hydroxyacylglutathione hydrolase [Neptunomonas marina]RVU32211.1 hydroxyacylglutathione hydrolase [Neptunomonas marina]
MQSPDTAASTSAQIVQVACLKDNYCYLVNDAATGTTIVIDTPDASAIEQQLEQRGWSLDYILTTHHHWDHIDGHEALVERYGCQVIGPKANQGQIPMMERTVEHNESLLLGELACQVLATPGHTLGHTVYYFPDLAAVFTGDTLFSMGCGRLFEGTAQQMWESMQTLKALPASTQVFCGHEYTQANARFAISLEPDNTELQARVAQVALLRERDLPTVPTLLSLELQTNPFLRADLPHFKAAIGMSDQSSETVFTEVRRRKDNF